MVVRAETLKAFRCVMQIGKPCQTGKKLSRFVRARRFFRRGPADHSLFFSSPRFFFEPPPFGECPPSSGGDAEVTERERQSNMRALFS